MFRLIVGNVLIATLLSGVVVADDAPFKTEAISSDASEDFRFFESKIRPVLVKHCYDCHSAESGLSEGGLRVDDREALKAGGERGRAILPGRPAVSLLLTAMSPTDSDLKMPPKSPKLSDDVIRDFKKWIEEGLRILARGNRPAKKRKRRVRNQSPRTPAVVWNGPVG